MLPIVRLLMVWLWEHNYWALRNLANDATALCGPLAFYNDQEPILYVINCLIIKFHKISSNG